MQASRLTTTLKSETKTVFTLWLRLGTIGVVYGAVASALLSMSPKFAPFFLVLTILTAAAASLSVVASAELNRVWNRLVSFFVVRSQELPSAATARGRLDDLIQARLANLTVQLDVLSSRTEEIYGRILPRLDALSAQSYEKISRLAEREFPRQSRDLAEVKAKTDEISERKLPEFSGLIGDLKHELQSSMAEIKSTLASLREASTLSGGTPAGPQMLRHWQPMFRSFGSVEMEGFSVGPAESQVVRYEELSRSVWGMAGVYVPVERPMRRVWKQIEFLAIDKRIYHVRAGSQHLIIELPYLHVDRPEAVHLRGERQERFEDFVRTWLSQNMSPEEQLRFWTEFLLSLEQQRNPERTAASVGQVWRARSK